MQTDRTPIPELAQEPSMQPLGVPAGTPLDVVPVASFRTAQAPNRKSRRTDYHHWGDFAFGPKQTVKAYSHRTSGSLLFVMPDNSAYEVQVPVVGNQVFRHWSQKQWADQGGTEPEEADPEKEPTPPV